MKKNRYSKNLEGLISPTDEQTFSRQPLLKFSDILNTRNNQLATIADEILNLLESGISKDFLNMPKVERAGILAWLWVLGAYEIIRTMCQAKKSFSSEYMNKLTPLKQKLAKVRMPDAKMEKQGQNKPVSSNRSPWAEDIEKKDLLVGDPEQPYSLKEIIDDYFAVINSLTLEDILTTHEESYS